MGTLGDIGELGLIDRIARLAPSSRCVVEGIGDDCAVVRVGDRLLLVSCDLFLEDVHFRRETASPYDIGWKAAASALSDIAAMGGRPLFCLVSFAAPRETEVSVVEELYQGLIEMVSAYGTAVAGGDTARSDGKITVDVMVVGETVEDRYVCRKGAQPGDLLAVTGRLGLASAGLRALEHGDDAPALVRAHQRPVPRIAEGQWLAGRGDVRAMIDISDGLIQDAGHLADASELGIDINPGRLPVDPDLARYCTEQACDAHEFILTGGEDYELAFAVDKENAVETVEAFCREFPVGAAVLGRFSAEWRGMRVGGNAPARGGFEHFK